MTRQADEARSCSFSCVNWSPSACEQIHTHVIGKKQIHSFLFFFSITKHSRYESRVTYFHFQGCRNTPDNKKHVLQPTHHVILALCPVPAICIIIHVACFPLLFFKLTSLMFEWVICLLDMPMLSPPTSHLTVYEASAEHKHSPHQWALRSEQNWREFFQPEPKQQSILVQFRLFKCFFSERTCEELNGAIWEHMNKNMLR